VEDEKMVGGRYTLQLMGKLSKKYTGKRTSDVIFLLYILSFI